MAVTSVLLIISCVMSMLNAAPDIGGCNYVILSYSDTNNDIRAAIPTDYCITYGTYSSIYMCDICIINFVLPK